MSEQLDTFLAITGSSDSTTAEHFLEMSNNNLDVAISLFFEHGGSNTNNNATSYSNHNTSTSNTADLETDEQMAQRLQQEAYKSQQDVEEPRAPMEARHERLVGDDGGLFTGMFGNSSGGFRGNMNDQFFGRGRRGIFNQIDDDRIQELDDDDEEDEDNDGDDEEGSGNATQRRLAKIFRPPFDLIEKLDLNSAKVKARKEAKWVMVNIQDTSDFQCQILNRDFWSNLSIKELIKEHFVFLQYHKDSRNGEEYSQFYYFDKFPHIAILDPITGERLKSWDKVPQISGWISEVYDFLNQFSLDPSSVNPTVKHDAKIDVNSLSEEKQLEYAIQQSLNKKNYEDDDDLSDDDMDYSDANDSLEILEAGDENDPIDLDSEEDEKPQVPVKELTEQEKIARINALEGEEPTEGQLTRIQIRTGDGKRVIRKFNVESDVKELYAFVKGYLIEQGLEAQKLFFVLTSQRENLVMKLGQSIEVAGLKNASVLVEVINDDDEE